MDKDWECDVPLDPSDPAAVDALAQSLAKSNDLYYGVGLQSDAPRSGRGKADTISAIGALWFDFDIADPGHKQTRLPSSLDELNRLLDDLPIAPTALIHSGGGVHAYWLLDQPWSFAAPDERDRAKRLSDAWQRLVKAKAEKVFGWRFDTTSDLARVLRLPGTLNHKLDAPRPVTLTQWTGSRYSIAQIEAALPRAASLPVPRGTRETNPDSDKQFERRKANLLLNCPWVAHCRDDAAQLPEPEWYGLLTLLARCGDGRGVAHAWSAPYGGYSSRQTDEKLDHAAAAPGPRTCESIRNELGGEDYCRNCRFAGQIRSPISLAEPQTLLATDHAYVVDAMEFFHLKTRQRYAKDQFADLHSDLIKNGGAAREVLNSSILLRSSSYDYRPGQPVILMAEGQTKINLWVDDGIKPHLGDVGPFLAHLAYLVPDEMARRHLLQWIAFTVQKPGEKIKHALILCGQQGTGKSYVARLLKALHGKSNVHEVETDELHSQFTAWLEGKQIILIEELMAFDRRELANKLKPLITQEVVRVNQKHKKVYSIRNLASFFCTTNHDEPIVVDEGDRRWWFYQSPALPREPSYYHELEQWTAANAGAIKQYLLDLDISGFNPNAAPPLTEDKKRLIRDSLPAVQWFLQERRDADQYPFDGDLARVDQLVRYVREFYPQATPNQVAKALRKLGAQRLDRVRDRTGQPVTIYAVRRQEVWKQASPEQVRESLEKREFPRLPSAVLAPAAPI